MNHSLDFVLVSSNCCDPFDILTVMVGATHCSVPGCNYSKRKRSSTGTGSEKRSLFAIHRPDLAKTNEGEKHRLTLTKFILSMRDFSKGDCIKDMLKKET